MKKFIENFFLFFLLSLFFYVVFIFLSGIYLQQSFRPNLKFPFNGYGNSLERFKEVDSTSKVDVLFLGNSHAYRGFDPRIFKRFGYTSFNLGSSSQTPIQTELLLERYLINLSPKLIVYEVSPINFTSDGVESAIDIVANDKFRYDFFRMALKVNNLKVYNATFFSFCRYLTNIKLSAKKMQNSQNDFYISGGYVQKQIEPLKKELIIKDSVIFKMRIEQLKAFENVINSLSLFFV